ncbi:aminopeptidase-like protein [Sinorhizobium fredii]
MLSDFKAPGNASVGEWCFSLAEELWPINRSLTGEGVRTTLSRIKDELPALTVHEVPSGTAAFDWVVPDEWTIREAYIEDGAGNRIVDFKENNLHVLGYSEPVDEWLDLEDLQSHLYSQPDQPEAIPYVTSYYKRRWGFCLPEQLRQSLPPGKYRAFIDSDLKPGVLNYGELFIPGETEKEVFLSTYVCHPSMANNELSGPVVTTAIAKWLSAQPSLRYSYRIVFIPETIGSIVYLSRNLDELRSRVFAGFNISCIGDDRCYSFLPSRAGDTPADVVAQHVLKHIDPAYKRYTWLDRGSDERQYCAPGADLPVATIMRSKYGQYPEYHTSLDRLGTVVTAQGLAGGFGALRAALGVLENDFMPLVTTIGEPQLGKRGLYPDLSQKGSGNSVRDMMNMISHCDGTRTLFQIAETINVSFGRLLELAAPLLREGLLKSGVGETAERS